MIRFSVFIAILAFTVTQALGSPGSKVVRPCKERCFHEKEEGATYNCKGRMTRWYFNRVSGNCEPFPYFGCNKTPIMPNRFPTVRMCEDKCGGCPKESDLPAYNSPDQMAALPNPTNLEKPPVDEVEYFFRFAVAAFCDKTLEDWTCPQCINAGPDVKLHKVLINETTENLGFIAINSKKQEIILAYRGSKTLGNWIQDIDIRQVKSPYNDGVRLHAGFNEATLALQEQVLMHLKALHKKYPNYRVVITGGSLGASMASISLYYLLHELPSTVKYALFTYGQPRSGNRAFVDYINALHIPAARIINGRDAFVRLMEFPPLGYVHHLIEYWDYQGVAEFCETEDYEDPNCSISLPIWKTRFSDHMTHFGISYDDKCP